MKVPVAIATLRSGSRPRLKKATDAVRSGAAIGRFFVSRKLNMKRFGPQVCCDETGTSRISGAAVGGAQSGSSPGTGAFAQIPPGRLPAGGCGGGAWGGGAPGAAAAAGNQTGHA